MRRGSVMDNRSSVAPRPNRLRLTASFTPAERQRLLQLQEQYQRGGDFLNSREYASLRFMRWLYQTGRLQP
jgi:hypothetical protein